MLMNGNLIVNPVYLCAITLSRIAWMELIILDIGTPPPLANNSFAFDPVIWWTKEGADLGPKSF